MVTEEGEQPTTAAATSSSPSSSSGMLKVTVVVSSVTEGGEMDRNTTQEDPGDSELPSLEKSLQLVLPVAVPFLLGALCFLYRYLYVSSNMRLARRPGDSDPPSTSESSQESPPQGGAREGSGQGGARGRAQEGQGRSGVSSGMPFTVATGVTGASFAPVCSAYGLGVGASIFAWQDETRQATQYGLADSSSFAGGRVAAGAGTHFQNVFAHYSSEQSFSNFETNKAARDGVF